MTSVSDKPLEMRLLLFILILGILFGIELLEPVRNAVILPFTAMIADISAFVVQFFDPTVEARGIVLRNMENGAAVAILPGCNGIDAMIVLLAAIASFPASWREKAIGLIVGFGALQALNIVRIICLFYLLQWNMDWFEWAHLYIWQVLIMLDALIVFFLWIRWLPAAPTPTAEDRVG